MTLKYANLSIWFYLQQDAGHAVRGSAAVEIIINMMLMMIMIMVTMMMVRPKRLPS